MDSFDYIIYALKLFYMIFCIIYIFLKLTGIRVKNKYNYIILFFMSIFIVLLCTLLKIKCKHSTYSNLILYFCMSFCIGIVFKKNTGYAMITTILSFAICYIMFVIANIISFEIEKVINLSNKLFVLILIICVHVVLIFSFFKIKRFKNGFNYLKNDYKNSYLDITMFSISGIILYFYTLITYNGKNINDIDNFTIYMVINFFIFAAIMILMIKKTIVLSYKQKLLENTLKDYEDKIKEKDLIIQNLSDEKFKISKLNHEFYNRQKALEMKVENALSNMNYEIGEESNLKDKIEELSKEYTNKVKESKIENKLPKTDIEEIDDMFKYMQSECIKNGIEFILQVNGNIHYLVNNIIDKTKLVTLIGDHLRDAIIAINYSDIEYKSILAILGIKENCYEFCIYDSGIEFEIETFQKLGLEPATTHKDNGGTGIGFITTFETLNKTKASLIIEEKNKLMENNYTKAVKFRFDNKSEFRIISYRASKIKENIRDDRILIQ